jgi:hypothetical protein
MPLFKTTWFPELLARAFADRPRETIWEWADADNVFLDSTMADEAQFYRSRNTPWCRRIQELCQHPYHHGHRIRKIPVKKSSQSGFTEAVLNAIRWFVKFAPRNVIYSINSVVEAGNIRNRLVKTFEALGERIFTDNEDDLGKLKLTLLHMLIWLFGSYSPGSYANKQAPFCVTDEAEEHARITGQTRSVDDLDSRLKNAEEGLHVVISKPKLEHGIIDQQHKLGDREIYLVPCPHCETLQEITIEAIKFGHCKNLMNEWDLERVMIDTHMQCQANGRDEEGNPICGKRIEEQHKEKMVQAAPTRFNAEKKTWEVCGYLPDGRTGARWLGTAKGDPEVVSMHISDLYSLKKSVSWGNIAKKIIQTKGDSIGRMAVWNHNLGLEWKEFEVRTEVSNILGLRGAYKRGEIPFEPAAFLMGADVGLDYVRWVVGAFDAGTNLALVDWGTELHPNAFLEIVEHPWPLQGDYSKKFAVSFGFPDAKYRKEDVYAACLRSRGRLIPCSGSGSSRSRQAFAWGRFPKGLYPPEFGLISFNDRDFKSELYIDRIRDGNPKLIVPIDVDIPRQGEVASLIAELCAEQLKRNLRGYFDWDRGSRPNHYGDCVKLILVGFRFSTRDRRAPEHEIEA